MKSQTTPLEHRRLESAVEQACDRALEELTNTRVEQAELARQAVRLGALLAGNGTASQREQGIRDLIEAVVSASERGESRFAELAAALARAGIDTRSVAAASQGAGQVQAEADGEDHGEARTDLTGF